jgi:hypothetical protein
MPVVPDADGRLFRYFTIQRTEPEALFSMAAIIQVN